MQQSETTPRVHITGSSLWSWPQNRHRHLLRQIWHQRPSLKCYAWQFKFCFLKFSCHPKVVNNHSSNCEDAEEVIAAVFKCYRSSTKNLEFLYGEKIRSEFLDHEIKLLETLSCLVCMEKGFPHLKKLPMRPVDYEQGKQLVIQHIVICTRENRKPTPKYKYLQTFAIFWKLYPVVLISCPSTQYFSNYLTLTYKTI